MNKIIVKKAVIFSLIMGIILGFLSLIPPLIGFVLFFLTVLCAPCIILFMKHNEKHLGIINNEQAAILGGFIGLFSTIGFFISFAPTVCILHLLFKSYYSYMIPDMLHDALWLFFIIVIMVAGIFAATNSASAMGIAFLLGHIEKKPENYDSALDIKIED